MLTVDTTAYGELNYSALGAVIKKPESTCRRRMHSYNQGLINEQQLLCTQKLTGKLRPKRHCVVGGKKYTLQNLIDDHGMTGVDAAKLVTSVNQKRCTDEVFETHLKPTSWLSKLFAA